MAFLIFICVVWSLFKIAQAILAKEVVCRDCGFTGELIKKPKGNLAMEIVLWLCFLVPGLLYSVWRMSNRAYCCPTCGGQQLIPTDSPIGRQLIQARTSSHEVKSKAG